MIFHTSDVIEAFDAKLYIEHLTDMGKVVKIEVVDE